MKMYLVHFLTLVFLLTVIPNSSGDRTGQTKIQDGKAPNTRAVGKKGQGTQSARTACSTFVTKLYGIYYEDEKTLVFAGLPSRKVILDMLEYFTKDPNFYTADGKKTVTESNENVGTDNVSAEKEPQNNVTSISKNAEGQDATHKTLKSGSQDVPNISSATVVTCPRLLPVVLQHLAESVSLGSNETNMKPVGVLELVDELLKHETILTDIETLTAQFYVEALAELYNNIKDDDVADLYGDFGPFISNKDFPYVAADMVMTSPGSFSNNAIIYVIGDMGKYMNLKEVTDNLKGSAQDIRDLVRMFQDYGKGQLNKPLRTFSLPKTSKTVGEVIKAEQKKMDDKKNKDKPKAGKGKTKDPREDFFNKIRMEQCKSPENQSKKTNIESQTPEEQHMQSKPSFFHEFMDVKRYVERFVISPAENKQQQSEVKPEEFDVVMLLNVDESYSNKSVIAKLLMSKLELQNQKIVFWKFFGRKISELITKLTQRQKIELLRNFLESIITDQEKTLNCISEILLRFPHMLTPKGVEAAATRRIPHWNADRIRSFIFKFRDMKPHADTNQSINETVDHIKNLLNQNFHGIYDIMVSTVLEQSPHGTLSGDANEAVKEATAKKSNVEYVPFFGEEYHEREFEGIPMFGGTQKVTCNSAVKWMMLNKALLFRDDTVAELLQKMTNPATPPGVFRKLSGMVNGFNQETWNIFKKEIVYQGNALKFALGTDLHKAFKSALGEGKRFFEATARDQIYGIGLDKDDPRAKDMDNWRGDNLLGDILTDLWNDMFQFDNGKLKDVPIQIPYPRYTIRQDFVDVGFKILFHPDGTSLDNDSDIGDTAVPDGKNPDHNSEISVNTAPDGKTPDNNNEILDKTAPDRENHANNSDILGKTDSDGRNPDSNSDLWTELPFLTEPITPEPSAE